MPARNTSPGLPLLRSLIAAKDALHLAVRAVGVLAIFGVPIAPKPFKANGVVGKLLHELHEGVLRVRGLLSNGLMSVSWGHTGILLQCNYTVKV
jgi:hypothetical protein